MKFQKSLLLMIFNTSTKCINLFKNGGWFELCGNCIPPNAPIASSNSPVCSGDTLKLTATNISNATYNWSGPNGFSSTQQNPVIPSSTVANSGAYSVTVTLNNCTSPFATTTATVNQRPASTFTANPVQGVTNQNVTFSPTVTGAGYSWTFQNGTPATSTAQNPVVQWSATGSYSISLTVNQNGCSSNTSVTYMVTNCTHSSQTFTYTGGIQTFTIPTCIDTVTIEAYGAQGGNGSSKLGGKGAKMTGKFLVTGGQTLTIIVGQKGIDSPSTGSGGGGSGVHNNGTLMIIAGGGGGADLQTPGGLGATTANCGLNGIGGDAGAGGCGGANGGNNFSYPNGRGGKGWNAGSNGSTGDNGNVAGTFGLGGGGGSATNGVGNAGGGGGGYSGGGGGGTNNSAGGGGSYNIGLSQSNTADYNTGNGMVTITW
jgi:PKD repeat protein